MTDPLPRRLPPATPLHRVFEGIALAGLIVCVAAVATRWDQLPERIPVHFGWDGRPDAAGPRNILIVLVGVCVAIYAMLTLVARVPWRLNYPGGAPREPLEAAYATARTLLACCKAFVMTVFAWALWRTVETALGRADGVGAWLAPAMIASVIGLMAFQLHWARRLRRTPGAR